jgi:hypothetical protein
LWAAMRNAPALSPQSARDAAGALLKSHGLPPTGTIVLQHQGWGGTAGARGE